jgi:hypothetical protein
MVDLWQSPIDCIDELCNSYFIDFMLHAAAGARQPIEGGKDGAYAQIYEKRPAVVRLLFCFVDADKLQYYYGRRQRKLQN